MYRHLSAAVGNNGGSEFTRIEFECPCNFLVTGGCKQTVWFLFSFHIQAQGKVRHSLLAIQAQTHGTVRHSFLAINVYWKTWIHLS